MSKSRRKPLRIAWKSACATCSAIFHACYSAIVLLLAAVTLFAAYVATLDDIPVPDFIIREIREQLKAEGLTLRMDGIRFQPNGRIIVEQPQVFSPVLGSTVVAAETAIVKLKLSHLLFGSLALDEIRVSSGRFVLPAMLTPSGEPVTAIRAINLEATHRAERWNIHYATLAIGDLKVCAAGRLDDRLVRLPPPKPDAPKRSLTQLILEVAPKISRLQEELLRLDTPFCNIDLNVERKQQTATLLFGANRLQLAPDLSAQELTIRTKYVHSSQLEAKLSAGQLNLPQGASARSLLATADWVEITAPDQLLPKRIQLSATDLQYEGASIPALLAKAYPGQQRHTALVSLTLPDRPLTAELAHEVASKTTHVTLQAQLDGATLELLNPLAQRFAQQDLTELSQIGAAIDLSAQATFDPEFKPVSAEAFTQSGPVGLLGARIDYAAAAAKLTGSQIDVSEIRIRSGKQGGVIKVGYNLETLLRRVLVEGAFDPTLINGWFKPWWTAMWDGMTFPEEGMITYLDSQATFKRPETVRVTGTGYVQDFDLRGLRLDELRTRVYSRFHYVDLFEMELNSPDGQQAAGEIQFHMDRDPRDDKDKLTGIWIQAISTLDVKKAPQILWEIADDAREILAPYCYDLPPLIEARSASVRLQDEYLNDIDLLIQTETPFSFYDFPFDSLDAFVHIDDDVIDIPRAQADLGGGQVHASAFIIGDALQVDATLDTVGFGAALVAADTYFAADGLEPGEVPNDPDALRAYGGIVDARFTGSGIVGDALSFEGDGAIDIKEADFGSFRLFGFLSAALELTPLRFTTLSFSNASALFEVDRETVLFKQGKIEGGGAAIESEGTYNIETDGLDLKAKLFPFRNARVPILTPLINLPLDLFSNMFEVSVTGTFDKPKLRLFNPSTQQEVDIDAARRDNRPNRNPRSGSTQ